MKRKHISNPERAEYLREWRYKKKHGDGHRICAEPGCNVILNSYNRNECCSLHNFTYVKKHNIKIDIGYSNS